MSGRRAKQLRRAAAQARIRAQLEHPAASPPEPPVADGCGSKTSIILDHPAASSPPVPEGVGGAWRQHAELHRRERRPEEEPPTWRLTRDEIMAPGPLFPWQPWGYELPDPPAAEVEVQPAPARAPEHIDVPPSGGDDTQVIPMMRELVPA